MAADGLARARILPVLKPLHIEYYHYVAASLNLGLASGEHRCGILGLIWPGLI
jgi:hypothetical protein